MHYELPLGEIVLDFFDQLKTRTRGYASLDYHFSGYRQSDLVKLDILLTGEPVDALSLIPRASARSCAARRWCTQAAPEIPRQLFEVAIQAAIGSKVIARETVTAVRKDVHRQVLRRRHQPQAQAAREAEGRQEADEAGRQGRDPAGGLPRRARARAGRQGPPDGRRRGRSRRAPPHFAAPDVRFHDSWLEALREIPRRGASRPARRGHLRGPRRVRPVLLGGQRCRGAAGRATRPGRPVRHASAGGVGRRLRPADRALVGRRRRVPRPALLSGTG